MEYKGHKLERKEVMDANGCDGCFFDEQGLNGYGCMLYSCVDEGSKGVLVMRRRVEKKEKRKFIYVEIK